MIASFVLLIIVLFKFSDTSEFITEYWLIEVAASAGMTTVNEASVAGTSSFGMSGVNAHLLLHASQESPATEPATSLPWQKTRLYALPMQFSMCGSYASSKQHARFCCLTAVAGLSWLWEVTAAGKQAFSPAAAFECAASALHQCHQEARLLSNVTLEAATKLPEVVYTNVDLRTGGVHIESESSVAILSCYAAASPVKAASEQSTAGSSSLHTSLPPGRPFYGSIADSSEAGSYVLHPGCSTAALHLSTLGSPADGRVSMIQAISVPDLQARSRRPSALSTASSAKVILPGSQTAAFEGILTVPLPQIATSMHPARDDVLYSVDWLVDNVQGVADLQEGMLHLSRLSQLGSLFLHEWQDLRFTDYMRVSSKSAEK